MSAVHAHPRSSPAVLPPTDAASADVPFQAAAATVLGRLQESLAQLLRSAPGPTAKCTDVEKTFGIDAKLSWQVLRMATAANPLAVGTSIPARVSVDRLLKAASRRKVPAEVVAQVSTAFDEFDHFLNENAEDRQSFEAMLNAHLPEAREKAELASKQVAFKAMSQIRGIAMDAATQTFFRFPDPDGTSVKMVSLEGYFGLRRVKPEGRVCFTALISNQIEAMPLSLDGTPTLSNSDNMIAEFCTKPLPTLHYEQTPSATHHWMVGQDVGLRGAVDLVMAWQHQGRGRRFARPGEPAHSGSICVIDTPMKRLTFDMFVHKDLYPGAPPEIEIYQVGMHGYLRFFGDPSRAADRIDMIESVRPLGSGIAGARISDIPRYPEMLQHVYSKMKWNPADFRGHRLDVLFPVHGVQYNMAFRLPLIDK